MPLCQVRAPQVSLLTPVAHWRCPFTQPCRLWKDLTHRVSGFPACFILGNTLTPWVSRGPAEDLRLSLRTFYLKHILEVVQPST